MSTALTEMTSANPVASLDTLSAIAIYARSVNNVETLTSLTIRINAARELAKAQDDVRDIRRMLMHAEVAVLIRREELKDPKLTTWQKLAAKAFVRAGENACREYVDQRFEDYGKAQQIGRVLHVEQQEEDAESEGERYVGDEEARAWWAKRRIEDASTEHEEEVREAVQQDTADFMKNLLYAYTTEGEPFTVEGFMDAVLEHPEFTRFAECGISDAYRDGVRRVCREAVRRAGPIRFDGEAMPATVAIDSEHGWVRIPLGASTPSDLAATIREREAQIANDHKSVDRLSRFLESITRRGCGEFEPIADYLPAA